MAVRGVGRPGAAGPAGLQAEHQGLEATGHRTVGGQCKANIPFIL